METKTHVLTLHIDNHDISLGVYAGDALVAWASMEANPRGTVDQYAAALLQLLQLRRVDIDSLEGAVISSVSPRLTPVLHQAAQQLVDGPILLVGAGVKTGLDIRLDRASSVGTDFICNCVAALAEFAPPLVVVSMESTITFAAVDENGTLIGRSILPGIEDSLDALRQNAAQLPQVSFEPEARLLGKGTAESVRSGVLHGTASMLEGMCRRYRQALGGTATLVTTGWAAQQVAGLCAEPLEYRPRLLHDGLRILYHKNRA